MEFNLMLIVPIYRQLIRFLLSGCMQARHEQKMFAKLRERRKQPPRMSQITPPKFSALFTFELEDKTIDISFTRQSVDEKSLKKLRL